MAFDRNPQVDQMWEEVRRAYLGRDLAPLYGLTLEQATGEQAALITMLIGRLLARGNVRMVERMGRCSPGRGVRCGGRPASAG